jgi:hypothetical protein
MGKFKEIAIEEQQYLEDIKSAYVAGFVDGAQSNAAKEYWFNKFKQNVEENKEYD